MKIIPPWTLLTAATLAAAVLPACKEFSAIDRTRDGGGSGGSPATDTGGRAGLDAGTSDPSANGGRDGNAAGGSAVMEPVPGTGGAAGVGGSMGAGGANGAAGGRAGTGGVGGGSGGRTATGGSGGASTGSGGRPATGGAPPGTGGAAVGSGGATVGTGGAIAGTGGASSGSGGAAVAPAALTGTTTTDFGNVELGVASTTFTWTVRNAGGGATGTLALTNSNAAEVSTTNNCTGALAAGASCSVVVTIKAAAGGARAASLTLTGTPGGSVTLGITANGQVRVTVAAAGGGAVTSLPAGITCGTTCTMLVNAGTVVTLQARTTNGSNLFFSGWAGACASPARDCAFTANSSVSASATFSPMTSNLIFSSSTLVPVNKGSAAAYDAVCNTAATAAGINNTAGNGYVAFVSDAASLATTRIPATARGWVRMDGKPFGDTLTGMLADAKIFNSIMFHEDGTLGSALMITGSSQNGTLGANTCQNWTSTSMSDYGNLGSVIGGPGSWAFWNVQTICSYTATDLPLKLICMGTTKNAAVAPTVTAGKRIWVTSTLFAPGGGQTPDAKCQADRPAGVTTAVALISTTTKAASSALMPTAKYVRMDGTLVGTGAELAATQTFLASGLWQSADGVYRAQQADGPYPRAWTGSSLVDAVGTAATTCADWTSGAAASMGIVSDFTLSARAWWSLGSSSCERSQSLYCVQTAP